MTLPPMPEPAHEQVEDYSGIAVNKVVVTPLFTSDQMIAYAEQAVAAQVDRLRDENKRLWADAERYRWLRKNTIVLGIFHYQIDDELEELVDGRIAAALAALKEKLNERN